MKNKTSMIILLVIIASIFYIQPVNAAPSGSGSSLLSPVIDILNDLSSIIVGDNKKTEISSAGIAPDKIWLVVLGTAFMLTALLFAILGRVKLFDNMKGAKIIISLGLGFMTVALSPLCKYIATIGVSAISIVTLIALGFLVVMVYKAFHQGNKAMSIEGAKLSAELSKEKKVANEAKKEEKISKQDLDLLSNDLKQEESRVKQAENIVQRVKRDETNVRQKLQELANLIGSLARVRESGEIANIKQRILKEYSALLPTINDQRNLINELKDRAHILKSSENKEIQKFRKFTSLTDFIKKLKEQNKNLRITQQLDAQIKTLANQLFSLIRVKDQAIQQMEGLLAQAEQYELAFENCIKSIIQALETNNSAQALTLAQEALNIKNHSEMNLNQTEKDIEGLEQIDPRILTIINNIKGLIQQELSRT